MYFKEKLQVLIGLIENWLSDPEDDVQYKQWHENVKEFISHYFSIFHFPSSIIHLFI